jgi:hypothetical protein
VGRRILEAYNSVPEFVARLMLWFAAAVIIATLLLSFIHLVFGRVVD